MNAFVISSINLKNSFINRKTENIKKILKY